MKRLLRIGIVSLAAAVVLFAALPYMRAQGASSSTSPKKPEVLAEFKGSDRSVPHLLVATYMTDAAPSSFTEESAGFFTIDDTVTFKCLLPCTLEVDQTAQLGDVDYTSNEVAVGPILDGSYTGGPYAGETATDNSSATFHYTESFPLTPGTHTVQAWGDSTYGVGLGFYHNNYRVYVP